MKQPPFKGRNYERGLALQVVLFIFVTVGCTAFVTVEIYRAYKEFIKPLQEPSKIEHIEDANRDLERQVTELREINENLSTRLVLEELDKLVAQIREQKAHLNSLTPEQRTPDKTSSKSISPEQPKLKETRDVDIFMNVVDADPRLRNMEYDGILELSADEKRQLKEKESALEILREAIEGDAKLLPPDWPESKIEQIKERMPEFEVAVSAYTRRVWINAVDERFKMDALKLAEKATKAIKR
jgi:hypothetical protein